MPTQSPARPPVRVDSGSTATWEPSRRARQPASLPPKADHRRARRLHVGRDRLAGLLPGLGAHQPLARLQRLCSPGRVGADPWGLGDRQLDRERVVRAPSSPRRRKAAQGCHQDAVDLPLGRHGRSGAPQPASPDHPDRLAPDRRRGPVVAGRPPGRRDARRSTRPRCDPSAVHTSYVVGVAWMDTKLLAGHPLLGQPDPRRRPVRPHRPDLRRPRPTTLVAAFNAGFLMSNANGGYYTDGRRPSSRCEPGAASFVIYKNGDVNRRACGVAT